MDDVLTEAGVDLEGYSIATVYDISHDGRMIAGATIHEYYRTIAQPYVATLAIAEPSSWRWGWLGSSSALLCASGDESSDGQFCLGAWPTGFTQEVRTLMAILTTRRLGDWRSILSRVCEYDRGALARAEFYSLAVSGTVSSNTTGDATIPVGTPWSFEVVYNAAAPDDDLDVLSFLDEIYGIFNNTTTPPALVSFHYQAGGYEVTLDDAADFGKRSGIVISASAIHAIDLSVERPRCSRLWQEDRYRFTSTWARLPRSLGAMPYLRTSRWASGVSTSATCRCNLRPAS